eukprot:942620-Pelagomonas_calceolata.AAC.1
MAGGVSKYYERAWEYNPDGDRFEDRVGKILSRGHNLRDTFRSQAHQTARRTRVRVRLVAALPLAISGVLNATETFSNYQCGKHQIVQLEASKPTWSATFGQMCKKFTSKWSKVVDRSCLAVFPYLHSQGPPCTLLD